MNSQQPQHITIGLDLATDDELQKFLKDLLSFVSERGAITTSIQTGVVNSLPNAQATPSTPILPRRRAITAFPDIWESIYQRLIAQHNGQPFEFTVSDCIPDGFAFGKDYDSNHLEAFKKWLKRFGSAYPLDKRDTARSGHPRIFFYDPSQA